MTARKVQMANIAFKTFETCKPRELVRFSGTEGTEWGSWELSGTTGLCWLSLPLNGRPYCQNVMGQGQGLLQRSNQRSNLQGHRRADDRTPVPPRRRCSHPSKPSRRI